MRILPVALALSLIAGAAIAADAPPEAEAGLAIARTYAKSDKIRFRKVKVGADGIVCGLTSMGTDRDIQFMVNPDDQALWLSESPEEPYSDYGYGEKILRSTDREPYKRWKACQQGK